MWDNGLLLTSIASPESQKHTGRTESRTATWHLTTLSSTAHLDAAVVKALLVRAHCTTRKRRGLVCDTYILTCYSMSTTQIHRTGSRSNRDFTSKCHQFSSILFPHPQSGSESESGSGFRSGLWTSSVHNLSKGAKQVH